MKFEYIATIQRQDHNQWNGSILDFQSQINFVLKNLQGMSWCHLHWLPGQRKNHNWYYLASLNEKRNERVDKTKNQKI